VLNYKAQHRKGTFLLEGKYGVCFNLWYEVVDFILKEENAGGWRKSHMDELHNL
jgi:hypothetical protein